MSWSRRLGIAIALLLMAGGSIAFASQALPTGDQSTAPHASAPPPPAPALMGAPASPVRTDRVDVTALRPAGLRGDQLYKLRLYVNGKQVRDDKLPDSDQFVIHNVPLDEGDNSIRISLVGDGGESVISGPLLITLDDVAPKIRVSQPKAGEPVYVDELTLLGRTEAGADVSITDIATGRDIATSVADDGHFSAPLRLSMGSTRLLISSTDAAGNRSTSRINIMRAISAANLSLSVAPEELSASDLPAHVVLTADVRDELGHASDGAQVVFSVSPPDSETMTFKTTASDGRARWNDLVIDPGDATGQWLVTVLAVLPSGTQLRGDASFSLR